MVYNDIYFTSKYGKLYEKMDGGKLEVFEFKSNDGYIKNMFIKREIPIAIDGEKYYDITTPYGYGGPIIVNCSDRSKKDKLVTDYYHELRDYCKENNIVSEFIRFHPINNNSEDFEKVYDVRFSRKTIATNLKAYEDPVRNEFRKECQRQIRKAINQGVTYEIIIRPDNLDVFKEMYYKTMEKNNAYNYYYFDCKYFDDIVRNFKEELLIVNALFEDKIIASELCFASGALINLHLSGSLTEYQYLSPGLLTKYALARWGKENGFDYIHHGGGRTNDENDSLLGFKKKFGKNTEFNFYTGEKIWNQEIYCKLCEINNTNPDNEFFPAYRNMQ